MASMATSLDVTNSHLGHLNDLNDDVVVEVDVKEFLKSSIFIARVPLVPSEVVYLRRATPSDVARRPRLSTNQRPRNYLTQNHRYTDRESTYCQALLYEQRLQKYTNSFPLYMYA